MNVQQAKRTAKAWVEANRAHWPGLRAAHLVGGITTMADDEPFPAHKDVDLHLIFDQGSAALAPAGPFPNIIEVEYQGLAIEAGLKPVTDYRSVEAVLANPEVAHHLTVDSILHDPERLLSALQPGVRARYRERRWVQARLDFERRGLVGALALRAMAAASDDPGAEPNVLGYTSTFIAAALSVVTLAAPTTSSRGARRVCDVLSAYGRADWYEAYLAVHGVRDAGPEQVRAFLAEADAAFDAAVAIRSTPHPFQHKLHAHLKPYFVTSCHTLLAEGFHREAMIWLSPFYHASAFILLADGPVADRWGVAERHARLLAAFGMASAEARAAKFAAAERLYAEIFALAEEIIAHHPAIAA